jgi:hypothetical protein
MTARKSLSAVVPFFNEIVAEDLPAVSPNQNAFRKVRFTVKISKTELQGLLICKQKARTAAVSINWGLDRRTWGGKQI